MTLLKSLALVAALIPASAAHAQDAPWVRFSIYNAASSGVSNMTTASVCARVMSHDRNAREAANLITGTTVQADNQGFVYFPYPGNARTPLYFEGRVQFVITAPNRCPMACEIDFYWDYTLGSDGTFPETATCSVDMNGARHGNYLCDGNHVFDVEYQHGRRFYTQTPSGRLVDVADVDGAFQIVFGDHPDRPVRCGITEQIQRPTQPELLQQNPVNVRPRIPTGPIDPTRAQPTLPRN